eukprot:184058-Lingulodinium_polyedra.AAC.1
MPAPDTRRRLFAGRVGPSRPRVVPGPRPATASARVPRARAFAVDVFSVRHKVPRLHVFAQSGGACARA